MRVGISETISFVNYQLLSLPALFLKDHLFLKEASVVPFPLREKVASAYAIKGSRGGPFHSNIKTNLLVLPASRHSSFISTSAINLNTKTPSFLNIPNSDAINESSHKPKGSFNSESLISIKDVKSFNQWLAGLIDGDGCFLLSKKGYASLEINIQLRDQDCLYQIQQRFGVVKEYPGKNFLRYRLHNKEGLLNLIRVVNGEIRNPTRILQLENICKIDGKYPMVLL